MNISIPGADYTPQLAGYTGQGEFRFWCQKVLPIVYDDSLSYYELLNKVVDYLNNTMKDVVSLGEAYVDLQNTVNNTLEQFQTYINEYFDNLDVQIEINKKLDAMARDGSLSAVVSPVVGEIAPSVITGWLDENITEPTTPVVDSSLSVSGAAADAKTVGDKAVWYRDRVYDSDIDEFTYPGLWLKSSEDNPTNWPDDGAGILLAIGHYHSTNVFGGQICFTNGNKMYYRYKRTDRWDAWKQVSNLSDIQDVLDKAVIWAGGIGNSDMNELYDPAIWQKSGGHNPLNWPNNDTGIAVVFGNPSGTGLNSQFVVTNGSRFYYRYKISSGWKDWREIRVNNMLEQIESTYLCRSGFGQRLHNNADLLSEMFGVARSYYDVRKDTDPETGDYYLRYGPDTQGKISCSVFARLIMKGVDFDHSIYAPGGSSGDYTPGDDSETEPDDSDQPDGVVNAPNATVGDYGWVCYPEMSYLPLILGDSLADIKTAREVTTASMIANWFNAQGLRIKPLDDWSNVEPGDFIFYAHYKKTDSSTWDDPDVPEYEWYRGDNRFFHINHVALVEKRVAVEDVDTEIPVGERADIINFDKYIANRQNYQYPYVHTTIEVGRENPESSVDAKRYCVQRKWMEWEWDYNSIYSDAVPFDGATVYYSGDIVTYKGVLYQYVGEEPTSGTGGWTGVDWFDLTNEKLTTNNISTLVFVGRPLLGNMTNDFDANTQRVYNELDAKIDDEVDNLNESVDNLNDVLDELGFVGPAGVNLFDENFDESGYIVNGVDTPSNSYKRTSKYYPIVGEATGNFYSYLSLTSDVFGFVFYNSNKEFLANKNSNNTQTKTNTLPEGAAFFRVYTRTAWAGSATLALSYVDSYIPYTSKFILSDGVVLEQNLSEGLQDKINGVQFITAVRSDLLDEKIINIFDGSFPNSGYIDSDGSDAASTTYKRTDYIPVDSANNTLYFLRTAQPYILACCFYDSSKNAVGSRISIFQNDATALTTSVPIPSTASYIRMYTHATNYTGNLMLSYTEESTFVTYGEHYTLKDNTVSEGNLNNALKEKINSSLKLSGKTIAFIGDSIIGNFYDATGVCNILAGLTGATVINCAFGGSRLAYEHSAYGDATPGASGYIEGATDAEKNQVDQYRYWNTLSGVGLSDAIASGVWTAQDNAVANMASGLDYFASRLASIKAVDWSEVDYIMWEYGTNDFMTKVKLTDITNTTNMFAFDNAYRHVIETILTAYPNIRIITVTPIYRWYQSGGSFTSDSNTHTENDYTGVSTKLTDFVAMAQSVSREYQLPCIDDYYTLGANKFTRLAYFNSTDGTHPNADGRKRIAEHIAAQLVSLV